MSRRRDEHDPDAPSAKRARHSGYNAAVTRAPGIFPDEMIMAMWANPNLEKLPGAIVKVNLQNVRGHQKFEMLFSPHINFITGENGSGKSSVVIGAQLACGAAARHCWRNVQMFELFFETKGKKGERSTEMVAELELYNGGKLRNPKWGERITLRKRWTRDKNNKTTPKCTLSLQNGKPPLTKIEDVKEVLRSMFILPDLPSNFLTQQDVKDYLQNIRPDKLNGFFERASGLQHARDGYRIVHSTLVIASAEVHKRQAPMRRAIEEFKRKEELKKAADETEKIEHLIAGEETVVKYLARRAAQAKVEALTASCEESQAKIADARLRAENVKMGIATKTQARESADRAAQDADKAHAAAVADAAKHQQIQESVEEASEKAREEVATAEKALKVAEEVLRLHCRLLRQAVDRQANERRAAVEHRAQQRREKERRRKEAAQRLAESAGVDVNAGQRAEECRQQLATAETADRDAEAAESAAAAAEKEARRKLNTAHEVVAKAKTAWQLAVQEEEVAVNAAERVATRRRESRLDHLPNPRLHAAMASYVDNAAASRQLTGRRPIGPLGSLLSVADGVSPEVAEVVESLMNRFACNWLVTAHEDDKALTPRLLDLQRQYGSQQRQANGKVMVMRKRPACLEPQYVPRAVNPDGLVTLLRDAVAVRREDIAARWPDASPEWYEEVRNAVLTFLCVWANADSIGVNVARGGSLPAEVAKELMGGCRNILVYQPNQNGGGTITESHSAMQGARGIEAAVTSRGDYVEASRWLTWSEQQVGPATQAAVKSVEALREATAHARAEFDKAVELEQQPKNEAQRAYAAKLRCDSAAQTARSRAQKARQQLEAAENMERNTLQTLERLKKVATDEVPSDAEDAAEAEDGPAVIEAQAAVKSAEEDLRARQEEVAARNANIDERIAGLQLSEEVVAACMAARDRVTVTKKALDAAPKLVQAVVEDLSKLRAKQQTWETWIDKATEKIHEYEQRAEAAKKVLKSMPECERPASVHPSIEQAAVDDVEKQQSILEEKVEKLQRQLRECEARLGGKSVAAAREEYASARELHEATTMRYNLLERNIKLMYKILSERLKFLHLHVVQMRQNVNQDFAAAMRNSPMGRMEGRLEWVAPSRRHEDGTRPEDHKQEDDHLEMILRAAGSGHSSKSVKGFSGGERSYTTMALLCSLYRLVPTPFKMIDEGDVFADDTTRDRIFGAVTDAFLAMPSTQYVLCSPHSAQPVADLAAKTAALRDCVRIHQLAKVKHALS
eukprot:TRINITY_DN12418_c0_g1_i1.p1 TRINITY_DN12418_c0_g1~~TRINITY_DN12418_c0_g1_i1.p1  ORF type:complete len:1254 (+),score=321.42 TRINITY_DN12418_c0_g1_i1:97-3858(+)